MTTENENELLFVPLGGTEEIGMNFNLFGYGANDNHQWLIIDMGITFGDDTTPGVEVIVPDPAFIEERKDKLLGIVLTHGHEDHLGAVPYLWSRLECPVYATPFTAALLRKKLEFDGDSAGMEIIEVELSSRFDIGPFGLELITLTHSMPEPNAIAIRTPLGTIFHTGDWKFDPDPVVGDPTDEAALRALGEEGVLALIGDSTNVFVEGSTASESSLLENLTNEIAACKGHVAVCCFASNVARLKTIFDAATANGRAVSLVGRSLWRINAAARETGYFEDLPAFLEAEDAEDIPKDQILYICTGSQGEPRAAMARIASGSHRFVSLGDGDAVIFSSRIIPGNDLAIARLHNRLIKKGVRVVSETDADIHVSGHPAQDELTKMYQMIRPKIAIPVHGEPRHLKRHAELAKACQVPESILVENGSIVRIAPGTASIIDQAPVGKFALDGNSLLPLNGKAIKDRTRIMYNGAVVCTLVVNELGEIVAPLQITFYGLLGDDDIADTIDDLTNEVDEALDNMASDKLNNDLEVAEIARIAIRRRLKITHHKRPLTTVHVVRI